MEQHRIYLKSELGKLKDQGDASWFLKSVSSDVLKMCGMPLGVPAIVNAFSLQKDVNTFVDSLVDAKLKLLTKTCDQEWRKNGVYGKLTNHLVWEERRVPIDLVDVQQAEPGLAFIFQRHNFRLKDIVGDPELWRNKPYSHFNVAAEIQFPRLLGKHKSGRYKLFDGIHRAISLIQKGEDAILICFYES